MKQILFILLIIICSSSFSRDKKKSDNGLHDTISLIVSKVEAAINQDWFIIQNDSGFTVYYCTTCQQRYIDWENEIYQKNKISDEHIFDTLDLEDFFFSPPGSPAELVNFLPG